MCMVVCVRNMVGEDCIGERGVCGVGLCSVWDRDVCVSGMLQVFAIRTQTKIRMPVTWQLRSYLFIKRGSHVTL